MMLDQKTILLIMLRNKNNKNIQRRYNVYLQQTINALINSAMPEVKVAIRRKQNNPEKIMPSDVVPGPWGEVLDGIAILSNVAEWINDDLNSNYSYLDSDLRLMLKLCIKFKNGDHLNKSDIYGF